MASAQLEVRTEADVVLKLTTLEAAALEALLVKVDDLTMSTSGRFQPDAKAGAEALDRVWHVLSQLRDRIRREDPRNWDKSFDLFRAKYGPIGNSERFK